jgi:SAM-dependent methyltransferase
MTGVSYDKKWDELYGDRLFPRSPYDFVMSFVYRRAPKERKRSDIHVMEVGCGAGNNLWFAALEGFRVSGIDGSTDAIAEAKRRLSESGLVGDLQVADYTSLPFPDGTFDLVIDRGALTCTGTRSMHIAIGEIHRVLRPGGYFLFNPISDTDTSYRAGQPGPDDVTVDITAGDFQGVGQIRFVSRREIDSFLDASRWHSDRIERVEIVDMLNPLGKIISNWRVEAQKK